jgi:hypothetical protein
VDGVRLSLDLIRTDGGTQSRAALDDKTVAEYAEAMREGVEFPPVIVFHDGSTHWLADGFHRRFAAERAGLTDIEADVRAGTTNDALWYALGANRTHGLRLSRGDKRHAVELALRTWPDRTQREIAEQVGCDQGYVAKIKADVMTSHNVLPRSTRVDSMGRTQPTRKGRKGVDSNSTEVGTRKRRLRPDQVAVEVRATQIRELTAEGYSRSQIASNLGVCAKHVTHIASQHGIRLVHSAIGSSRRIEPFKVIESTCHTLTGTVLGLDALGGRLDGVGPEQAAIWADEINGAIKSLRRFSRQLRSIANEQGK